MAELNESQLEIAIEIEKIGVDLKKTGLQRRTSEYLKKCLDTLEQLWNDYQFNHDRLSTEISKTHAYFTKQEYERTKSSYHTVKTLISQMYQRRSEIPPGTETKDQPKASTSLEDEGACQQEKIEEHKQQEGGHATEPGQTTRRPWMVTQGTNSKLDDMLRKQAANFKAFRRTVSNINVDLISEKWEFEDALKTLQTRWSAIDTLHWEIDSELSGDNEDYESTFIIHE